MGEIGGSFSQTVKSIVSLPMVICCGRLVVVSSIPPGDFFFVFWANLLFSGGSRRAARDLGGSEKAIVGDLLIGRGWIPRRQKPRSWRVKPPVLMFPHGHSGAFFWAYGQIRAAARDVN